MDYRIETVTAEPDGVGIGIALIEAGVPIYRECFTVSLSELSGKTQAEQEAYILGIAAAKESDFALSREAAERLKVLAQQ